MIISNLQYLVIYIRAYDVAVTCNIFFSSEVDVKGLLRLKEEGVAVFSGCSKGIRKPTM